MTQNNASLSENKTLTVSQLTQAIKDCLEGKFPLFRLQGEVSNFKQQASGHLYFSLKDIGAQVSAVMFRGDASKLVKVPKSGDQVVVSAELSVYAPRGNYQLIVKSLEHLGLGELLLKLEALKKEIHARGWFSQKFKKKLPAVPKKIAVVTSPTGAVIQDILKVLAKRYAGFQLVLYPVKVQGEGAAEEITKAIIEINAYKLADVMIVGRGGGSIEDLWAFNDERVAKAIFESSIPIIGAVGHETDHCIAEYVADCRAPTPTAAAQMAIKEKALYEDFLRRQEQRLQQTLSHLVKQYRSKLMGILKQPVFLSPYHLLGAYCQRLDDLRQNIDQTMLHLLQQKKIECQAKGKELLAVNPITLLLQMKRSLVLNQSLVSAAMKRILETKKERLVALAAQLASIDPKKLLEQGYSIVLSQAHGTVVTDSKQVRPTDKLRVMFSKGSVLASVEEVLPVKDEGL